jgi:hypothetical protein
MLLSKKTVDVHAHGAVTVKNGGRQPRFAAALDHLLQPLL